jgi:hypothetical protein
MRKPLETKRRRMAKHRPLKHLRVKYLRTRRIRNLPSPAIRLRKQKRRWRTKPSNLAEFWPMRRRLTTQLKRPR